MSTTLTDQIAKAQQDADQAAAKASRLRDTLDQKRSAAATEAEERVRHWAQDVVKDHPETQRRLLEAWREARQAVEAAIIDDPQTVPRMWSQWGRVAGELGAEAEAYSTAVTILDPTAEAPSAVGIEMPTYSDLVDLLMRSVSETEIAAAGERRRAELEAAARVEGLG